MIGEHLKYLFFSYCKQNERRRKMQGKITCQSRIAFIQNVVQNSPNFFSSLSNLNSIIRNVMKWSFYKPFLYQATLGVARLFLSLALTLRFIFSTFGLLEVEHNDLFLSLFHWGPYQSLQLLHHLATEVITSTTSETTCVGTFKMVKNFPIYALRERFPQEPYYSSKSNQMNSFKKYRR